MKKNQKGLMVVEGLLIVVILGILVATCWYVIKANKTLDKTNAETNKLSVSQPTKKGASTKSTDVQQTETTNKTLKDYDISVKAPEGWTIKKDTYSADVTDGVGTVVLYAGIGGKGCEHECKDEIHDFTYDNQAFQETTMTGYPNSSLYWHVIDFKDKTKSAEWISDTTHTRITSINYPKEKRDYYLPIFTKIWLESVGKPVY